jgi:TetR/AcrR family transcriptional regulator
MVDKDEVPVAEGKITGAAAAERPTPEQILGVATRLFAEHGFDGTSLQDIADAVGLRKPSLLYHFPSKDDLRRAVLASLLSRWNDILPRLLMAAHSGEDQFTALVDETVGFFAADPDRARLLLREGLDRPAEFRQLLTNYVRPWVGVVADYVRKGVERGHIQPSVDPEAYVVAVINLILSSFATAACYGGLIPRDRQVAEVMRLAREGLFLAPRPAGGAPPTHQR